MFKAKLIIIIAIVLFILGLGICFYMKYEGTKKVIHYPEEPDINTDDMTDDLPKITIVFDNNPYGGDVETSWGFACVVEKTEKTILFDSGGSGEILLENMEKLKIDPRDIDIVFLSHIHSDHVGGVFSFLGENSEVTVYIPESFPERFKKNIYESVYFVSIYVSNYLVCFLHILINIFFVVHFLFSIK